MTPSPAHQQLIEQLLQQNRELHEQIKTLTGCIVEMTSLAKKETSSPSFDGAIVQLPENVTFQSQRLHSNEEEEDLEHALQTGQINKSEFQEALHLAGFANTDIEIG